MLIFITLILLILFAVSLYNLITWPVLQKLSSNKEPQISILIPVRNEEKSIPNIVNSVTNQTYKNYEVIFCDDLSTDKTLLTLRKFQKRFNNIKILEGQPLPHGWIGKNWACHQLSQNANGEIFIFLDADVSLSSTAIESAVEAMQRQSVDMLSIHPTQLMDSLGEWIIVPLLNLILLSLLPLRQVYSSNRISLTAANGQFMMFTRKAYIEIGGHKTVFNQVVEDLQLARIMKVKGYKILNLLGGKEVYCRMYFGLTDSIKGFSKNFFTGTSLPAALFISILILLTFINLFPLIAVFNNKIYLLPLLIILLVRIMTSYLSGQFTPLNLLLHPFQIVSMMLIGIYSVIGYYTKSIKWKERNIY